ncbi:nucleoside transporter-domain-containing protein, partial [Parasitella parasitica]
MVHVFKSKTHEDERCIFWSTMFKKWKSIVSFSNTCTVANDETQSERLFEPEEGQDMDTSFQLPYKQQNPLLIYYWVYFAYGIAMLLPWNVFITASDYFSTRFAGSDYQGNFQTYFSAYFNCSNLISLAVLLWIRLKMNGLVIPLSINLVIFLFFAISSLRVPTESAAVSYFWTTIACMIITGMTTSIIQLTVFAETSQMSSKYMQAVMSGQGIAGVSVALFSLSTTLLLNEEQRGAIATFYYFASALLVTLIAIIGRFALSKQTSYQLLTRHAAVDTIPMTFTTNDTIRACTTTTTTTSIGTDKSAMWDIITQKSAVYIFVIVYIYIITLALFPSVTVLIRSVNGIDAVTFISLHFLLFNIGDWIGRTLPIFACCQVNSSKALILISLARTCFIPLFFSCNLKSNGTPILLNSDIMYLILLLLFAISNGWLTSLVFIAAPSQVNHDDKPLVGSVISFFLVVGLALGG